MPGITIEFYIDDNGLKTAEIYERNIKAYFGKRCVCKELKNVLTHNCLYMLLNDGNENSEKKIYIGKASDICKRLDKHNRTKDWWTDFIVFTSDKFEESHLDYLEQKLFEIAKENAINAEIDNRQHPRIGTNVRNIKKEQSENYFKDMTFLLNNLNIVTLIAHNTERGIGPQKKAVLYQLNLKAPYLDKKAFLEVTKEGYVLKKGSFVHKNLLPSGKDRPSVYKNKQNLIDRKLIKLVENEDIYEVTADIPYASCSLPASVILGRPSNGRIEWKNKNGETIADIES